MAFELDTLGWVRVNGVDVSWPALSPFAQGYVEALFASMKQTYLGPALPFGGGKDLLVGFSDLDPSALALILSDCERFDALEIYGDGLGGGEAFWRDRQDGDFTDFPPLHPRLEDGRVHLEGKS